eukprot:12155415-Alexandrium_andersonii.AAC.1
MSRIKRKSKSNINNDVNNISRISNNSSKTTGTRLRSGGKRNNNIVEVEQGRAERKGKSGLRERVSWRR